MSYRGDEVYDPGTGTFSYLGVIDNGFVDPVYSLFRFRIMEAPEPGALASRLAAMAVLGLLARQRRARAR